jgi:hypothetical protein
MITTIINTIPEPLKLAFSYDKAKQKLLWYTDKLPKQKWINSYYVDDEEKYIYSQSTCSVRMAGHLFPQASDKKGFRFDKKTKKLTLWYGCSLTKLDYLSQFLTGIKKEWVITENIKGWLTKGLLEKILADKITNPLDACKYIIKANRIKNCSPKLLQKYIKGDGRKIRSRMDDGGKFEIMTMKDVVTSLDHWLESPSTDHDLVRQCKALGRTFDPRWSSKRLTDLHQELTEELMKFEIDSVEDESVEWPAFDLPKGFELITSKRRLFAEGKIMKHCVYTNYWGRVADQNYLVFSVTDKDGNRATAGFQIYGKYPELDQVNAKYNANPSLEIKEMVDKLSKDQAFLENFKLPSSVKVRKSYLDELENIPF